MEITYYKLVLPCLLTAVTEPLGTFVLTGIMVDIEIRSQYRPLHMVLVTADHGKVNHVFEW